MRYNLDVNYTLTVLPEETQFHHLASVELLMDVCESLFISILKFPLKAAAAATRPASH